MRNAALVLGILGGLLGMLVGFASTGYIEAIERWGEIPDVAEQVDNVGLIRTMGIVAPILALAGGAMAKVRALWGGILLLLSAAGMFWTFGYGVFTMFPIALTGLAGLLALAAGKPDEPKAHF